MNHVVLDVDRTNQRFTAVNTTENNLEAGFSAGLRHESELRAVGIQRLNVSTDALVAGERKAREGAVVSVLANIAQVNATLDNTILDLAVLDANVSVKIQTLNQEMRNQSAQVHALQPTGNKLTFAVCSLLWFGTPLKSSAPKRAACTAR